MKLDSNFKLSKPSKRILSIIDDPVLRGKWKKLLIQADSHMQDKSVSRFVMNYDVSESKARQILSKN